MVEAGIGSPSFEVAKREVKKQCRFFPTIKDVLDIVCEYWKSPANDPGSNCAQITYTGDYVNRDIIDYIMKINAASFGRKINGITAEKIVTELVSNRDKPAEVSKIMERVDDLLSIVEDIDYHRRDLDLVEDLKCRLEKILEVYK